MALIICFECSEYISEYSDKCIKCGCPMETIKKHYAQIEVEKKEDENKVERQKALDKQDPRHDIFIYTYDTGDIENPRKWRWYDGIGIEKNFPGMTPAVMIARIFFNHDKDFSMHTIRRKHNNIKEYNSSLNKILSKLPDEEKNIAMYILGINCVPISFNQLSQYTTTVLTIGMLHKIKRIICTSNMDNFEANFFLDEHESMF